MTDIVVQTKEKTEFADITGEINGIVGKSETGDGVAVVFTKHTTTGLIVNENEPRLVSDMKKIMEEVVPDKEYMHDEIDDNASSHLRSMFLGSSLTLPFSNGRLSLGTWQRVFLAEFDGPRRRTLEVKIL